MKGKQTIYFLCVGNSCRSQMAEGFAKKYIGDTFDIYSAGIEPLGINPWAVKVMLEKGIDISNQTSDLVSTKLLNQADYVITLCKDARERCPIVLPRSSHYHWAFDDPATPKGSEKEILQAFRHVRDEIDKTIQQFIQGHNEGTGNLEDNEYRHLLLKQDFGETIRRIRESRGYTLKGLAAKLQISEDYLSKTEISMTKPSKFFTYHLASACHIPYIRLIDYLYEKE